MPNQTPPEIEAKILERTECDPTCSYLQISGHLRLAGVPVSITSVRWVGECHQLTRRMQRLSEELKRLLARYKRREEDPQQHVMSHQSGYLLCQDTYSLGTIKAVGRIFMQSVVDSFCSVAFAKVYLLKLLITAADIFHERVLPFYKEKAVVEHLLTDPGQEFCGTARKHFCPLSLVIYRIEPCTTQMNSPQTNRSCERFHQTVADEFVKMNFRKKIYQGLQELQEDLDQFLGFYKD